MRWAGGVLLVFSLARLPALYLARWTACDVHPPLRAALLAIGHGCLAFAVIPSLILHATGCAWGLDGIASWPIAVGALLSLPLMVLGVSAVQMLAIHGQGTAIPLGPTRRLVGVGVFA